MSLRLSRRQILLGGAATAVGAGVGTAALTFRWHASPRRKPFLTDAHLNRIALPDTGPPRVLFIGNSMLLRHDVPGRVAALAACDGAALRPALAAANGARLVETLRIGALREAMQPGRWEALVLQDFTRTPLRRVDRWGSARAMAALADRVAPAPVLLCPPWPARADNKVYAGAGRFTTVPDNPADYAARTMQHYRRVAQNLDARVADVPTQWLSTDAALYAPDGHHANEAGAELLAGILWRHLRDLL